MLYPLADTAVEMGQPLKFIVDREIPGIPQLTLTVRDPSGLVMAEIPAESGPGGVYRSQAWSVPHRSTVGAWTVEAQADGAFAPTPIGRFQVKESAREELLVKYGIWVDPPSFSGINQMLYAERGDDMDGMIRWGGATGGMHVLPEQWLEVHWRAGDFGLDDPAAARRFLLQEIGDFGAMPIRELAPFEPSRFEDWPAWHATARGQFANVSIEWVVFHAPETRRSFAVGTTVVLPPAGVDAHSLLREGLELHPEVDIAGVAPAPLERLLPAPELLGPPIGTVFKGPEESILLRWSEVKPLADDEYYEVEVDYNYQEGNPTVHLSTRETQVLLPGDLYRMPNCRVFNWQVTLMRQTGMTPGGDPLGEPLSYRSFYWYIEWVYPSGETPPFPPLCPNAQV